MREVNCKLQYHLVDKETNAILLPGDKAEFVVNTGIGTTNCITGVVESFPSGCIKLENAVIPIAMLKKFKKLGTKIYILMEQECSGLYGQYDIMGTKYKKEEAIEWVNKNPEYRTYRETRLPN